MGHFARDRGLSAREEGRALRLRNLLDHAAGAERHSQRIPGRSEVPAKSAYLQNVDPRSIPRRWRYCLPGSEDSRHGGEVRDALRGGESARPYRREGRVPPPQGRTLSRAGGAKPNKEKHTGSPHTHPCADGYTTPASSP